MFPGKNNNKLGTDLVMAMQALGNKASYVRLVHRPQRLGLPYRLLPGPHLGAKPSARCTVISKDKGFDALIAFLKGEGHAVERSASIDAMPELSGIPLQNACNDSHDRCRVAREGTCRCPTGQGAGRAKAAPVRTVPTGRRSRVSPPPRPSMPILTLLSRTSLSAGRPCLPR